MRIVSLVQFTIGFAILMAIIYILNKFQKGIESGVTAVSETAKGVFKAVDPTSNENIFYKAANEIVGPATDGSKQTLGTWLAGIFDPTTRAANAAMKEPVALNDDERDPNNPPLYSPF